MAEQSKNELAMRATTHETQAQAMVVSNRQEYDQAATFLKGIKGLSKQITGTFARAKKAAHDAHKAIIEEEKKYLQPLARAERNVKSKMKDWWVEQENQRAEKEAALKREAEIKAGKIRQTMIDNAKKNGNHAQAKMLENMPVSAPPVALEKQEQVDGIQMVTRYGVNITNEDKMVRHIVDHIEFDWMAILEINESALLNQMQQMKLKEIPGAKIVEIKVVRA